MIVVVMGVAGSGKSTIAEILAQRLGWVFMDADQFHTPANKEKMQIAFEQLEHVFSHYKTDKVAESNRYPVGDPSRKEADISQLEKAHLDLLRANLDMEISKKLNSTINQASESSDKLGAKVWWLNVVMVLLTVAIAVSAVLQLFR